MSGHTYKFVKGSQPTRRMVLAVLQGQVRWRGLPGDDVLVRCACEMLSFAVSSRLTHVRAQADPPPPRASAPASVMNPQYGGSGHFEPANDKPRHPRQDSSSSASSSRGRSSTSHATVRQDSLPESLRPSSSLAGINLYNPEYDSRSRLSMGSSVDTLSDQMSEFGLGAGPRRRESFPVRIVLGE